MDKDGSKLESSEDRDFFVPLFLIVVSLLLMTGGRLHQLLGESESLAVRESDQEKPLEDARNVRNQFDSITTGAAKLAALGNPHARLVIDELAKQGVIIQEQAKTAQ